MESRAVYFIGFLLVGALALPQHDEQVSIDDSEQAFFFSNTRIVGGEDAPVGSVPWMAGLSTGNILRSFVCGASLISSKHVLTAAHCVDAVWRGGILGSGSLVNSLRIHVGSNRWNRGDTRYSVSGNFTHPNWLARPIKNDIAVLVVDGSVELNDLVSPVPLSWEHVGADEHAMVAGWGRIRAGGSLASNLKRVFVKTLEGSDCARKVEEFSVANNYVGTPHIEEHLELCTFLEHGQGTCNGDSGSALTNDKNEQIGVVSWGFPCAIGAPDMFARVSGFRDFIVHSTEADLM